MYRMFEISLIFIVTLLSIGPVLCVGQAFYAEVREPRQGLKYVLPPPPQPQPQQAQTTEGGGDKTLTQPMIVACTNPNAEICIHITRDTSNVVLPRSCFACSRTDLQLSNLISGSYKLSMEGPDGFLSHTHFEVVPFQDATAATLLPRIEGPQYIEFQVDPPTYTHDVTILYNLVDGAEGVNAHVNVCIEVTGAKDEVFLSQTCVAPSQNRLTLQNVPEGDYTAYLYLRRADAIAQRLPALQGVYSSSIAKIEVRLHRASDFSPSYEWQRIHVWDRVQPGLDIRLPMSAAGGEKVGRIPEPWRLQAKLPADLGEHSHHHSSGSGGDTSSSSSSSSSASATSGFHCKAFFVRMDVHRGTSLLDLKNAAVQQCRAPSSSSISPHHNVVMDAAHCLVVVLDEKPLDSLSDAELGAVTSESHGLFSRTIAFNIREECK